VRPHFQRKYFKHTCDKLFNTASHNVSNI
jgi:hypothetical protein